MHCYAGDPSAGTTVHDAFPNKDVWLTECSRLTDPGTPSGFVLGQPNADVIVPMLRNYAKSFVLWNAVLDQNSGPHTGGCTTCLGLLKIDDSVSPATVSPVADYYLVGQFSKYTRPGAYQVRSDDGNTGGVLPVAFRNPDGSIVLVAYNNTADNVSFDVPWSGKSFNYTQPAGAVTTFVWSPATLPAVAISMAPSGLLLSPGATGNIALTFDPVNGANTQVALACSGAPIGAACSFTPSSLSISGSTQATASLKLTTTAPANRIATHSRSRGSVALLAGMALFVVGMQADAQRCFANACRNAGLRRRNKRPATQIHYSDPSRDLYANHHSYPVNWRRNDPDDSTQSGIVCSPLETPCRALKPVRGLLEQPLDHAGAAVTVGEVRSQGSRSSSAQTTFSALAVFTVETRLNNKEAAAGGRPENTQLHNHIILTLSTWIESPLTWPVTATWCPSCPFRASGFSTVSTFLSSSVTTTSLAPFSKHFLVQAACSALAPFTPHPESET